MHQRIAQPSHRHVDVAFFKAVKRIDAWAALNQIDDEPLAFKVPPHLGNVKTSELSLMLPMQLHPQPVPNALGVARALSSRSLAGGTARRGVCGPFNR
jgi:hypothetical protein